MNKGYKVVSDWLADPYSVSTRELDKVIREARPSYYIRAAADAARDGDAIEAAHWLAEYKELSNE